jgi:hypothetical protein
MLSCIDWILLERTKLKPKMKDGRTFETGLDRDAVDWLESRNEEGTTRVDCVSHEIVLTFITRQGIIGQKSS